MRRFMLLSVGALILFLAAGRVWAEDQNQAPQQNQGQEQSPQPVLNSGPNRTGPPVVEGNIPPAVKVLMRDPNRRLDPNARAAFAKQMEQMRQQTRKRAMEQGRQLPGGRPGRSRPMRDVNAPPGDKGEPNIRVRNAPGEKMMDEGARHQQRLTAIEQQISNEEAKHRDRLARLERIRELAQQQNDTETLARVNKLIEQEQRLYDAKTLRMTHRKSRIAEFSEKAASDKDKKKTGADKDGNQPAVENK